MGNNFKLPLNLQISGSQIKNVIGLEKEYGILRLHINFTDISDQIRLIKSKKLKCPNRPIFGIVMILDGFYV